MTEDRVETYARLMEAQVLIARAREKCGTAVTAIEAALDESEPAAPEREGDRALYLSMLRRYVDALGGELREQNCLEAVFPEETIGLPPAPPGGPA